MKLSPDSTALPVDMENLSKKLDALKCENAELRAVLQLIVDKLGKSDRINRYASEDWAEDHTHLQSLCLQVGCTPLEVNGDSYGVPGIQELADMLRAKIPLRQ